MITDADIEKLTAVFATKEDLKAMENRFDHKFATKKDLKNFKKDIIGNVDGKLQSLRSDIDEKLQSMETRLRKDIVEDVADMLQTSVIKILGEHEKRLDRLEKHVGGFPTIA